MQDKITSVVKPEKNPGRVAAGKRLAAISKEAKERKKQRQIQEDVEEATRDYVIVLGVIATVLAGAAVYFLTKSEQSEPVTVTIEEPKPRPKRSFIPYSMADNH